MRARFIPKKFLRALCGSSVLAGGGNYFAKCAFVVIIILTATCCAARGDALRDTANQIADEVSGKTKVDSSLYAPSFLQLASTAQLDDLYAGLRMQYGAVVRVTERSRQSGLVGYFEFDFKDSSTLVTLSLEAAGAHRVDGLFFAPVAARMKSLKEVEDALAKLPGAVTFDLVRLDDGKVLGSLNPDRALAIGSAFKLYLLAELEERGIAWDRVVKVEDKYKSLPTGEMRNWPAGSPVTVDTMAVKMISESDNTAADHMLGLLGRENVEGFLGKAGMANPAADIPFLSTGEAFALKANASMLADYLKADVVGRRAILEKIDVLGMEGLAGLNLSKPVAIDKIEWFASAADLCRVMEWFDKRNDPTVLGILAVNPGLGFSRETFEYVGYKGGSEPGVLNLTWLLRSRSGKHYAMSAGWNDPAKDVDLGKFSSLMMAAADLIEDGQK